MVIIIPLDKEDITHDIQKGGRALKPARRNAPCLRVNQRGTVPRKLVVVELAVLESLCRSKKHAGIISYPARLSKGVGLHYMAFRCGKRANCAPQAALRKLSPRKKLKPSSNVERRASRGARPSRERGRPRRGVALPLRPRRGVALPRLNPLNSLNP